MTFKEITGATATASPKDDEIIKSVIIKSMNRARLFWKSLTVIFFLTTIAGGIMWKIESYAHQMDAKVIRLEVEKELRANTTNAKPASTPETIPTSSQAPMAPQKVTVSLK